MSIPPATGNEGVITATIANGAQLSDELDVGDGVLAGLIFGALTGTQMTFQVAKEPQEDGGTWRDLYEDGTDNTIVTVEVAANQAIGLGDKGKYLAPFRHIKLKSGSAESAERTVSLIVKR